jgi:hypothetical protein
MALLSTCEDLLFEKCESLLGEWPKKQLDMVRERLDRADCTLICLVSLLTGVW